MRINMQEWAQEIIDAKDRRNLPVIFFPCVKDAGYTVPESVTVGVNMANTMKEVINQYPDTIAAVTGMDLTVDTEAFGGVVKYSKRQAPGIKKHVINTVDQIADLQIPDIHAGRQDVCFDAITEAQKLITDRPIFGGMLGPFSLAANIMEVSNALISLMTNPEEMKVLIQKSTDFLINRAKEYKRLGANGIFIAEPTAGLLNPAMLEEFSSVYIRQLVDAVQDDYFFLILHDCGEVTDSVTSMYNTGCKGHHYGNKVDMVKIMEQIPEDILVFGNIDPSTDFFTGTPESIRENTLNLLKSMEPYPHFVLSSGCDLAPMVPKENLEAYYEACREYNQQIQSDK